MWGLATSSDLVRLRRVGERPRPPPLMLMLVFGFAIGAAGTNEPCATLRSKSNAADKLALSEVEGSVRPTQSSYFLCFDDFLS
jgi:hypothetical protein